MNSFNSFNSQQKVLNPALLRISGSYIDSYNSSTYQHTVTFTDDGTIYTINGNL